MRLGGLRHAVDLQLQQRARLGLGAGPELQRDELDALVVAHHLVIDQGDDVLVVDDLLAVGQVLEAAERVVQRVVADIAIAQRVQLVAERGAAGMLAHHQAGLRASRRFPAS